MQASAAVKGDLYRDCLLCGLRVRRYAWRDAAVTRLCHGCLVRIEAELTSGLCEPCRNCGRHPDLCARTPCVPLLVLAGAAATDQVDRPSQQPATLI